MAEGPGWEWVVFASEIGCRPVAPGVGLVVPGFAFAVQDYRGKVVVGVDGVLRYEVACLLVEDVHGSDAALAGVVGRGTIDGLGSGDHAVSELPGKSCGPEGCAVAQEVLAEAGGRVQEGWGLEDIEIPVEVGYRSYGARVHILVDEQAGMDVERQDGRVAVGGGARLAGQVDPVVLVVRVSDRVDAEGAEVGFPEEVAVAGVKRI